MATARVRREGMEVLVIFGERGVALPPDAAIEIGRALIAKAREAQEIAAAEQIILENAILFRAGIPIGLSNNRDIVRETINEAQHNPLVRRHMAGGIRSTSVVGTPVIRSEPPHAHAR